MNVLKQGLRLLKRPSIININVRRAHAGGGFIARNLFLVNSLTSGGFMSIGDLIQQEIEYQSGILKKRYDWNRNFKMLVVGLVFGPIHHFYYVNLDHWIRGQAMKEVLYKITLDQVVAAPLTYVAFFITMGALEQKTAGETVEEFKSKIWALLLGDCVFWPPVQFVNFYFLSTKWRVIYINLATMIFNIYISYVKFCDEKII